MHEISIQERVKSYSFYHVIKLTDDLNTPGVSKLIPSQQIPLRALRSINLKNRRVLDIGCRDGLFSFEAERLGAQEVVAIDNNLSAGAVELLIPYFKSKIKMYELNLLDLTPQHWGTFDVIIFTGVLYHLRYPFWSLRIISEMLRQNGFLILETSVLLDRNRYAMLYCPTGDESPYEATSCTFFNLKALRDTLYSFGLTTQDVQFLNSPYRNWYRRVKMSLRPIVRRNSKKAVDRATLVCRKTNHSIGDQLTAEGELLSEYWNSTHKTTGWFGRK